MECTSTDTLHSIVWEVDSPKQTLSHRRACLAVFSPTGYCGG
jgi:hypothetical protein